MKCIAYIFCFILALIGLFAIAAVIVGGKVEEMAKRMFEQ